MDIRIEKCTPHDSGDIARMVKELLEEIMGQTGLQHFNVDLDETRQRCLEFLEAGTYTVFKAVVAGDGAAVGFISLYESYALYAEGVFGTIPELYVRPDYRSKGVGAGLVGAARAYGAGQGWKRLEVTTPPLPEFDGTFAFYKKQGFTITGGRKLKAVL